MSTPEYALYARVSTDQQESDGTSLETQVELSRAEAGILGFPGNPKFVWKDSVSGIYLERPGLNEMRHAVANNLVDAVIVYKPDRLARDPFIILKLIHECEQAGVALHFVLDKTDASPEGKLITYIKTYVAQREHKNIAENTLRGKNKVAQNGRLPCGTGTGLYGYDYDKMEKVRKINETEGPVVKQIFQWALEGRSVYKIAVSLNEAKIPTKRGKMWWSIGVERILKNPAYTGVQFYGQQRHRKLEGGRIEHTDRPEDEWIKIEGFTPPLVTEAQFEKVQRLLTVRQAKYDKRIKQQYLLTGLVFCGTCGMGLAGSSFQRFRLRYYRCRGTWHTTQRASTCHEGYIPADDLEAIVWRKVTETIRDPSALIGDWQSYLDTGEGNLGAKMKELRKEINDLTRQQRRLLELYQSAVVDQELLETQLGPLKFRRDEKESGLRVLEGAETATRRCGRGRRSHRPILHIPSREFGRSRL